MMDKAEVKKYVSSARHKYYLFSRILLIALIPFSAKAQQIEVDNSYTPQQLADIFIGAANSGCIEIFNVSMSNYHDFDNGEMSYGYFTKSDSNFDIDQGILLTTGKARSAVGPNDTLLSEGPSGNSWLGDLDLEQVLGINNTTNATVLEFDFIAYTTNISFEYLFASEQYLTSGTSNQCNYTDGFAFLIKKVDSDEGYENLAVVPNTNTPVAVNTVRGEGGLCPPVNSQYFGSYNDYDHSINYNGQTVVMTAETQIEFGELYHIKLVIADQGNNLYDSAVFLKAGSFGNGTKDLGKDRLVSTGNPVCEGETFVIDATTEGATTYQWYKDGVIISGEENSIYEVTETGNYEVEIGFSNASCSLNGSISVEFSQSPTVNNASLLQCESNNGITIFNLTTAEGLLVENSQNLAFTYFSTLTDAENNHNSISNYQNYPNTSQNQSISIYVRVTNSFGCYSIAELTLSSSNNALQNPPDLEACEESTNGYAIFDLSEHLDFVLNQITANNPSFTYHKTFEEALLLQNALETPNYQGVNNQTIFMRISDSGNCYGIVWFDLIVHSFDIDLSDEEVFVCENESAVLTAPSGYYDYTWSNGATSQSVEVGQSGSYVVSFTNELGCEASKTFLVNTSSVATILSIEINDLTHNGNTILVKVEGLGNYEYSINGIHYQESGFFTNVPSGQHLVFVRDKNGCGEVIQSVFVLEYPKFFTPNGDGHNDYWTVPMLSVQYPQAQIEIYDRYGKLLHGFSAQEAGWDGMFNSKQLPATDYWFVIRLSNRVVKGHFSLVR